MALTIMAAPHRRHLMNRVRNFPYFRYLRDALVFAPCYVALDWASYFDALGPFNITPWNPQAALAVAWMMLGGMWHWPAVLATIFAADVLVRGAPGGHFIALLTSVALAGGYAWMAWLLRALLRGAGLRTLRELNLFVAVATGGAALVGVCYVGVLRGAGLLEQTPVPDAWLRFWVGDAVGVLVTLPLLLAAADAARRAGLAALARRGETLLQACVLVATIWLIFEGLPGEPAVHFYALFVPLIWIAARAGTNGAIVAVAIVQLGVVAGMHAEPGFALPVQEIQALVAALTLTGLYLGMMVDERERANESLRQTLRLAAAGDMAGAIAHELNQPLTALASYGQSALVVLARNDARAAELPAIIDKMLKESQRAAEVVRRLRDFFRAGTTRLEPVEAGEVAATVQRIAAQIIGGRPVKVEVSADPALPPLYVDRLQVELVLRNLVANAVEAVEHQSGGERRIGVRLARRDEERLSLVVRDSGPGIARDMLERVFEPFVSGKPTGMGLGLAISRAIAEAHGGALVARAARHGEFELLLPCLSA
jgi:signal transduction histidine kinase